MRSVGLLLKASYLLHRHQWYGAPLDRWLAVGIVFVAGFFALGWLPGGAWGAAACGLLFLLLIATQLWASHRHYLLFRHEPRPVARNPSASQLDPSDKRRIRASGVYEVEGKQQSFTELEAFFRSFETREHAVMALVPPSKLLIGSWPDHEVGMWYIFFHSHELGRVDQGRLCFGRRERPALRLQITQELPPTSSPLDVWGGYRSAKKQRKPKTRQSTVYLSFDTPEERQRVLADLIADATGLGE